MATQSERFHAEGQRTAAKSAPSAKKPAGRGPRATPSQGRAKQHAEKKATYALEPTPSEGRPSRKSTRKSANRAKPDTNLVLAASRRKSTPEARARKANAQRARGRAGG